MDSDYFFNVIGTIGGFAISLSLVPQVYLTYKTKCADDISYAYQFIYIFGTGLVNTYAIYFGLQAVYIPCLVEMCLIVTLTVMKWYYPEREEIVEVTNEMAKSTRNLSQLDSRARRGSSIIDASMARKSITVMKRMSLEQDFDLADSNYTSNSMRHIMERLSSARGIAVDDSSVEEAASSEEDPNPLSPHKKLSMVSEETLKRDSLSGSSNTSNASKEGA